MFLLLSTVAYIHRRRIRPLIYYTLIIPTTFIPTPWDFPSISSTGGYRFFLLENPNVGDIIIVFNQLLWPTWREWFYYLSLLLHNVIRSLEPNLLRKKKKLYQNYDFNLLNEILIHALQNLESIVLGEYKK